MGASSQNNPDERVCRKDQSSSSGDDERESTDRYIFNTSWKGRSDGQRPYLSYGIPSAQGASLKA